MPRKNKKDDLDMETSFADMNVEGFRWYDPYAKKNNGVKQVKQKISRKEYWAMVRGAFAAMLPMRGCIVLAMAAVVAIAYLWLG